MCGIKYLNTCEFKKHQDNYYNIYNDIYKDLFNYYINKSFFSFFMKL